MRELAAAVRAERKAHGLSQSALAAKAGVGRDWIIELEKGKSTAEVGLVLRTLRALGMAVQIGSLPENPPANPIQLGELLGDDPKKP